MLYVYVYEGGDNYLSNSQVPNTNFHVPITNYRLPVERDADNGEGGDEAEEDREDSGHCAKETAYETWNDEDDQVDDDDDDDNDDGSMRQREKSFSWWAWPHPLAWPNWVLKEEQFLSRTAKIFQNVPTLEAEHINHWLVLGTGGQPIYLTPSLYWNIVKEITCSKALTFLFGIF